MAKDRLSVKVEPTECSDILERNQLDWLFTEPAKIETKLSYQVIYIFKSKIILNYHTFKTSINLTRYV